jgi:hypothetical protein
MEAKYSSETSVDFQRTARCYIRKDKTNYMELSPYWEAANCAANQELPNVLWKS